MNTQDHPDTHLHNLNTAAHEVARALDAFWWCVGPDNPYVTEKGREKMEKGYGRLDAALEEYRALCKEEGE